MKNKNSKQEKNIIVEARDLSKVYDRGHENEIWAIKDINMKIEEGEFVAIMGPSGSGKTTLLNCISGIDEASDGSVFIAGEDLQGMKDRKKTKYRAAKMGFVFQTFNLIPVLTAIENVEMPLLITGMSAKNAYKQAKEMLERVGLGDRLNHKPSELSGGQRQRVTIARALVHKPAVVWADEPTGNLDTKTADEVMDMMMKFNRELNETFVVVTHDPEIAKKADRIIRIEDGSIKN